MPLIENRSKNVFSNGDAGSLEDDLIDGDEETESRNVQNTQQTEVSGPYWSQPRRELGLTNISCQ